MSKLERLLSDFQFWSIVTFNEATSISSLTKLHEELDDIKKSIIEFRQFKNKETYDRLLEKYSEAIFCLCHSMAREGISIVELVGAIEKEFDILKKSNSTYSHQK